MVNCIGQIRMLQYPPLKETSTLNLVGPNDHLLIVCCFGGEEAGVTLVLLYTSTEVFSIASLTIRFFYPIQNH